MGDRVHIPLTKGLPDLSALCETRTLRRHSVDLQANRWKQARRGEFCPERSLQRVALRGLIRCNTCNSADLNRLPIRHIMDNLRVFRSTAKKAHDAAVGCDLSLKARRCQAKTGKSHIPPPGSISARQLSAFRRHSSRTAKGLTCTSHISLADTPQRAAVLTATRRKKPGTMPGFPLI